MHNNIIYKITHTKRLEENNPPYYYIGSKYHWKGEGTYYGSSSDERLSKANKDELLFEVLCVCLTDDVSDLQHIEKDIQIENNVLKNSEFFNRNIACTSMYLPWNIDKRVEKFKKKANSVAPSGELYKDIWGRKAQESLRNSFVGGIHMTKIIGQKVKEKLTEIQPCGRSKAQIVFEEKVRPCFDKVDENGLSGWDKQGIKLKETLSVVGEDGLTIAQRRALSNPTTKPTDLLGMHFSSETEAMNFFGVTEVTFNMMLNGEVKPRTYAKLLKRFDKSLLDEHLKLINVKYVKQITVCGVTFPSYKEAASLLGLTEWSFTNLTKGEITPTVIKAMINYFGKDIVSEYYAVD